MEIIKLTPDQFNLFKTGHMVATNEGKEYYHYPYWLSKRTEDVFEVYAPVEIPIRRRETTASGLKPNKYHIVKADGETMDPNAFYFVLRLDADPHARKAALAYAQSVEKENPELAEDLKNKVYLYEPNLKLSDD